VAGTIKPGLITVDGSNLRDVELILTDRQATVSGTVRRSTGGVDTEATVVIFPADRTFWYEFKPFPPGFPVRLREVRVSQRGQYRLTDIPAGEYLLAALNATLPSSWKDPGFLTGIASNAVRVQLTEGASLAHDLKTASAKRTRFDR